MARIGIKNRVLTVRINGQQRVKNHHRNNLNLAWSLRLLTLLQRSGVRDFCIAPGSRSAPLALAAEALARESEMAEEAAAPAVEAPEN